MMIAHKATPCIVCLEWRNPFVQRWSTMPLAGFKSTTFNPWSMSHTPRPPFFSVNNSTVNLLILLFLIFLLTNLFIYLLFFFFGACLSLRLWMVHQRLCLWGNTMLESHHPPSTGLSYHQHTTINLLLHIHGNPRNQRRKAPPSATLRYTASYSFASCHLVHSLGELRFAGSFETCG